MLFPRDLPVAPDVDTHSLPQVTGAIPACMLCPPPWESCNQLDSMCITALLLVERQPCQGLQIENSLASCCAHPGLGCWGLGHLQLGTTSTESLHL